METSNNAEHVYKPDSKYIEIFIFINFSKKIKIFFKEFFKGIFKRKFQKKSPPLSAYIMGTIWSFN